MPGLDPGAIEKIVASLDAEISRRRARRDEAEDARWAAESDGDELILFAKRLARDWDRSNKESQTPVLRTRDEIERAEDEIIQLMEIARIVESFEQRKEDAAAGIPRRAVVKVHVRSLAK